MDRTIIAFIDLQQEYLASGRAYALDDIKQPLANCRSILNMARTYGMTIAHFRLLRPDSFFNPMTQFSHWIEDFRPRPNEMIFEREKPSLFSNKAFTSFAEKIVSPEIVVIGLSGQLGCLASILDAAHRDYRAVFVKDASASQAIGHCSEQVSHNVITGIIATYAQTLTTQQLLSRMKEIDPHKSREITNK